MKNNTIAVYHKSSYYKIKLYSVIAACVVLAAVFLPVYFIYQESLIINFLFLLLFPFFPLILFFYNRARKSNPVFTLDKQGIKIKNKHYKWKETEALVIRRIKFSTQGAFRPEGTMELILKIKDSDEISIPLFDKTITHEKLLKYKDKVIYSD